MSRARTGSAWRLRRQGRLWLALACCLGLAGAWLLAGTREAQARAGSAAPRLAQPALAPWERIASPAAQPASHAAISPPAAAGTPMLRVSRSADGEILIAVRAASHRAAAEQLSALTQSELRLDADSTQAEAGTLTLSWRGRDVAQAWQALLGAGSSHALQCQEQRCRVWLFSAAATGPASTSANAKDSMPAALPPPSAAAIAEIAHKAPAAPPAAIKADPPGLFPSE